MTSTSAEFQQDNPMNFSPNTNMYANGNISGNNGYYQNQYSPKFGNGPSPVEMFYRKNGGKHNGYSNRGNRNTTPYFNNSPRRNSYNNSPSYRQADNGQFSSPFTPENSFNSLDNTPRRYSTPYNGNPCFNKRSSNQNSQSNRPYQRNFNKSSQFNKGQNISSYFSNSMIEDPWTKTCKKVITNNSS